MTPVGMTYEAAKKRAAPYDKIVGELHEMRAETVELVKQDMSRRIRAYVLVNNRTEGNAPLTIQALVDLLTDPALQGGKAIYESENRCDDGLSPASARWSLV